jgi:phage FluMu protein Com
MATKKQEIKCPWCEEVIPTAAIKVAHVKNDYGTTVERRCSKCNKVLAAYLEQEGEFLSKMRTF